VIRLELTFLEAVDLLNHFISTKTPSVRSAQFTRVFRIGASTTKENEDPQNTGISGAYPDNSLICLSFPRLQGFQLSHLTLLRSCFPHVQSSELRTLNFRESPKQDLSSLLFISCGSSFGGTICELVKCGAAVTLKKGAQVVISETGYDVARDTKMAKSVCAKELHAMEMEDVSTDVQSDESLGTVLRSPLDNILGWDYAFVLFFGICMCNKMKQNS
jgi:hypothetical protein